MREDLQEMLSNAQQILQRRQVIADAGLEPRDDKRARTYRLLELATEDANNHWAILYTKGEITRLEALLEHKDAELPLALAKDVGDAMRMAMDVIRPSSMAASTPLEKAIAEQLKEIWHENLIGTQSRLLDIMVRHLDGALGATNEV